ncbi:MAG: DEAD/DEAH box helicase family protein, partial [Methylococcales bacterium]
HLSSANDDANPGLPRLALKLATGAGKTTVMAMLIAWHTINAVRRPSAKNFTRGFLIVAPGLTIRDRLRVLKPNDPDSYYKNRELVPSDLFGAIERAKIVTTNYHAFKLHERLELSKGGRLLLQGKGGQSLNTLESEGQMLQRVMPELMGMKNILVINDEAHHCYREKRVVSGAEGPNHEDDDLTGEDKQEARKNNEAARLWISGLEIVKRKLGIARVIDLSATPFFLRGSGYAEGTLFPWTMSDFSLMDAIECGIVKLPRVPVADNVPGGEMPKFRNLWEHIRARMPKKGRGHAQVLDPLSIPVELQTALEALYGHYEKTFNLWQHANLKIPPCFIVVCNNTSTSKLVYDYISGFHRANDDGSTTLENGRQALFRNFDEHGNPLARPRTVLIDSEQLESGDALDNNFREMACDEIHRFRREIIERTGNPRQAENLSDQELLREVMNTVGKEGRLGESIRCVVSVSMLTEGWDCLDQQTEILTVSGWKGVGQILEGEPIYSLNPESQKMEIVPVLEYAERIVRSDERMVTIRSQHFDIRTTEGHRFYIKYRDPKEGGALSENWLVKTGLQLHERNSSYALPLAAELSEPFPGVPLTDDEIRLIAWFMTDGGFSGYRLTINQSKHYHYEIRALLQRLEIDYSEQINEPALTSYQNAKPCYRFSIPKGTHTGSLKRKGWIKYVEYLDKRVSERLHQMTREQFQIFWQELLKGDGKRQGDKSGWLWCCEKHQADAYTHIAVIRGFAASYHLETTDAGNTVYRVTVRNRRWMTTDPSDPRSSKISLEKPNRDETVWCVRNRNATLVTRRNGKIVILGNCNTVTHVLGVRAFGTQLLCEQVIGRALRRQSYDLNEENRFNVEYADVLGIPFDFTAKPVVAPPQP